VVGEETNKLMGYLACVSRKLDKPLAVIIQSSSAAGKSSLMDAILNLMPEEERVQYSAMTGQSLFYMGETNLKHKILAIAEEEGADSASYALKLLQSEGELTIASTGKDESSGNLVTKEYHVQGPVMLFLTTTAIDIDEELMNRCMVLTVNESREQTQAIHAMQRSQQTLAGLLQNEDKKQVIELHRNAQRLLKPLLVANPFAEQLTFIDDKTRTRRDHMKYLTLIRAIALLHQYQRDIKTVNHNGEVLSYIEVMKSDIAIANRLAHDVLGRSLDELPPQTRTLLKHVHRMVDEQCKAESIEPNQYRFSRRDVREYVGWTDFQIKKHMSRLQEMEYVLIHRGGRGQSFVYELLYQGEGDNGESFVLGLSSMESLTNDCYDEQKKPLNENKEPPSRPQGAAKKPQGSTSKKAVKIDVAIDTKGSVEKAAKSTVPLKSNGASHRNSNPVITAPAHPAPAVLEHPCSSVAE
jgi:DNA primase